MELRPGGALPPSGAHPVRPRHRRQRGRDGLRQPRRRQRHRGGLHPRPGHRRAGRVRRLPAERAGRGRGGGHPQHGAAAGPRGHRQGRLRPAHGHHADARGALPRPVRHRVHDRARQALDAADPGRQADRRGGLPDRDPAGQAGHDRPRRGAHPGHRGRAHPADVPPVRHQRRRHPDHHRDQRLARARPSARRSSTRPPRSPGPKAAARRSSSSAARPTPRTCTA